MMGVNKIISDHAPIRMGIQWNEKVERVKWEGREQKTRSVTRLDTKGIREYNGKLESYGKARNWRKLKDKVISTILRVEVRGRREEYYEEKWWDEECHRKKEALNKTLKDP